MAKIAVTITAYALVPAFEFDERIAEIQSGLERGLQAAGADYVLTEPKRGIPAEFGDDL